MSSQLTKKQAGFVKDYLDTGNGTQSVLNNYDTKDYNTASVIAYANLRKVKIQEAIDSHAKDAESMIYKLSQEADGEMVRLNASKDIMDRAGFKPVEKTQSTNTNINVEIYPELEEITNKLNDLYKK